MTSSIVKNIIAVLKNITSCVNCFANIVTVEYIKLFSYFYQGFQFSLRKFVLKILVQFQKDGNEGSDWFQKDMWDGSCFVSKKYSWEGPCLVSEDIYLDGSVWFQKYNWVTDSFPGKIVGRVSCLVSEGWQGRFLFSFKRIVWTVLFSFGKLERNGSCFLEVYLGLCLVSELDSLGFLFCFTRIVTSGLVCSELCQR
ncbi:hypothetical protein KUTeg_022701 [Tegillarca granosa]|uniref:Uncharacterized protein n=1 Tax=Tegillarca granosa TaxID=220873 RepID=A0ABQ9DZI1_TEGGR|nr:hypothetical protein KUTeg_022701 [Tegillarca granosa]